MVNFSLGKARKVAWDVAINHAPLDGPGRQSHLERVDLAAALLGRAILQPPALLTTASLLVIRGREISTTARVIDILMDVHPLPYAQTRDSVTFNPAL